MAVESAAPATGAISREQAIGALNAADPEAAAETPAEETPVEEAQPETEQPAEEAPGAEEIAAESPAGEEQPLEETPETEGETPQPSRAPQFWNAEEKAEFDSLPTKAQEIILAKEQQRNAFASRAAQEAAQVREQATAAQQHAANLAAQAQIAIQSAPGLDQEFAPGVVDPNTGQPMTWAQIDLDLTAQTDPVLAGSLRAIYNDKAQKRAATLQAMAATAQQAQAQADNAAYHAYLQTEAGKLEKLNPKLFADGAKRQAIAEYLVKQGIDGSALKNISATELTLAEKAMNWDKLNAGKGAAPATPAPRAPARPGVRPSGSAPAAAPAKKAAQEAGQRFAQTKSKDDAIAFLNARN